MSFFTFFGGLIVTLTPSVVSFVFFIMSNNLLIVFTLGGYVTANRDLEQRGK